MRRREFVTSLCASAAWHTTGYAQQTGKVYRVAWVSPSAPVADLREDSQVRPYRAFQDELRRLGYAEGKNLILERYSGEGRPDQYEVVARHATQSHPDAIFTSGVSMTRQIQLVADTIPIIAVLIDPIAAGFTTNLALPSGNVTGVSVDAGMELWGKRLAILKEAFTTASRVGYLGTRTSWEHADEIGAALRAVAPQLSITLFPSVVNGPQESEYRRVFASMPPNRIDAVVVSAAPEQFTNRGLIVELARQTKLPVMYPYRDYVELGGLMAYATDLVDVFRQAARQVADVLKGAKPSDIPFYQQTKFELVVNLKTAKALGLTMPPSVLAIANEVIE